MASRFSNLRGTLKSSTETVWKQSGKVSEYKGPSVGARTSGDYGSSPKPIPLSFFFTQEFNAKWICAITAVSIGVVGSFVPFWTVPFYRKTANTLRQIDDEFGPTKYGAGKKFSI